MVKQTTSAQQQILDAIRSYTSTHGYPPTWKELAALTGRQPSTIQGHMIRMRRKGLIEWRDSSQRSLQVCGDVRVGTLPLLAAQTGQVREVVQVQRLLHGDGTFIATATTDLPEKGVRAGDVVEVLPGTQHSHAIRVGDLVLVRDGQGTALIPFGPAVEESDNVLGIVTTVIRSLSTESVP